MNKFHARKTEVDGIVFDSIKESVRYSELKFLERGHAIRSLVLQPEFMLQEGFTKNGRKYRPIYYKADFMYIDCETGQTIVEDVKSPATRTPVYMLKKKLFEYIYRNMEIREI